MRLYVPEIGDILTLQEDWTFELYDEYRNDSVLSALKLRDFTGGRYSHAPNSPFTVTFPAGTVLKVDRIYIRKGMSDFSSISFFIESSPLAELSSKAKNVVKESYIGGQHTISFKAGKKRFWAKLSDCNRIEFKGAQ